MSTKRGGSKSPNTNIDVVLGSARTTRSRTQLQERDFIGRRIAVRDERTEANCRINGPGKGFYTSQSNLA
jgi:hypothetical protein